MCKFFLNLIFPPKCIFCGELLKGKGENETCLPCRKNLPYCMALNIKGIEGDNFIRAVSAFIYKDYVADSIYRFKSRGCRQYAKTYASYLKLSIEHYYKDITFDFIVSVPMTKRKLAERGYNQAQLIAQRLSSDIGIPYLTNALIKSKETTKQQNLSRDERKYNLAGVFEVAKSNEINGKTILLIDDVFTTGATIEECSYALLANGAESVYAATVAVTMLERH